MHRRYKIRPDISKKISKFLLENFLRLNPQKRKSAKEILSEAFLFENFDVPEENIYLSKEELWRSKLISNPFIAIKDLKNQQIKMETFDNFFDDPLKNNDLNLTRNLAVEDDDNNLADFSESCEDDVSESSESKF